MAAAIDVIIGGIDVPAADVLIVGGGKHIFGEETRWGLRDKFIRYKHAAAAAAPDAEYMRILGVKPRVTFNKRTYSDDTKERPAPIPGAAAAALAARLEMPIDDLVTHYIREYDLPRPMRMALCDMIKYLTRPGRGGRAAAEGALASSIKMKCGINVPMRSAGAANMFEFILDMIPGDIAIAPPILIPAKRPCICAARLPAIAAQIDDIKKTCAAGATSAAEYAFAILRVEEILSPHLLLHEKYYITHAKNIAAILEAARAAAPGPAM